METTEKTTKIYLEDNGLRKTKIKFIRYNFGDQRRAGEVIAFKDIERVKEYMKENNFNFECKLRNEIFFSYKSKTYGFKIKEISY